MESGSVLVLLYPTVHYTMKKRALYVYTYSPIYKYKGFGVCLMNKTGSRQNGDSTSKAQNFYVVKKTILTSKLCRNYSKYVRKIVCKLVYTVFRCSVDV